MLRRFLLAAGIVLGLLFLVVALYLAFMTVTDYRPAAAVALQVRGNAATPLVRGEPISVLSFNIGYAGMDAGADFFMDGGRGSRGRSLEQTRENLRQIAAFLAAAKADLVLLQEVDLRATRSYGVDERSELKAVFPGYGAIFAVNYKVPWVPVPLARPMGAVHGGLLTFSRFPVRSATRLRLPGSEPWPRQLAELDRCLCECRLPVRGGGELVLFHLHLSAFDRGGRIRRRQLDFLKRRLLAEQRAGHYVLAGGDWNHGLAEPGAPGAAPAAQRPSWYVELPADFTPPGFTWALDPSRPTVRGSATAYRPGESFVAVIDGFLASANIEVKGAAVRDLDFRHSDHNPVAATLVLK